jgi:hypothetical protein
VEYGFNGGAGHRQGTPHRPDAASAGKWYGQKWNACVCQLCRFAAELAIDRAHRIGQTRPAPAQQQISAGHIMTCSAQQMCRAAHSAPCSERSAASNTRKTQWQLLMHQHPTLLLHADAAWCCCCCCCCCWVQVTRITIPGTVEERILELQVGHSRMFKCMSYSWCSNSTPVGAGGCVCDDVDPSCVATPVLLVPLISLAPLLPCPFTADLMVLIWLDGCIACTAFALRPARHVLQLSSTELHLPVANQRFVEPWCCLCACLSGAAFNL